MGEIKMDKQEFVQALNPVVTKMPLDRLVGFQSDIRSIPDLVYLTFGEPGFNTAEPIKETMIQAIRDNESHYANSQGEPALREAAKAYYNQHYGLNFASGNNVIVTAGVSEAINVVLMTLLAEEDGLMIPTPAYPPYYSAIKLAHGTIVPVDTKAAAFKLTPAAVEQALAEATVPVKAVLLNYPANPTGVTYTPKELAALADVFAKHQLWVISDEIYAQLTYDQAHTSLVKYLPEQTILITGLSKSHAMTGYRMGFILAQEPFIQEAQKVHSTLTFALPKVIQEGAVTALTKAADVADKMRLSYQKRRDWLVPKLKALGFEVTKPEGAFYVFAKIPADFGQDAEQFAYDLARKGKVAVVPGGAFADTTEAYVRISYAASDEDLHAGMARLKAYIENHRQAQSKG
ncbi:L-aspartate aminotransferase [Weissella halotolerans DSM 20190]|uniref:Aminotransferase n=2 Tax=Weissella halotolerans TaxID=1615 RepID=A0A0R2FY14_9LACO|nr:L-aspartate aminotransferase [Weissella halotolerans DSM 20190]